jgi:hypothetical protein
MLRLVVELVARGRLVVVVGATVGAVVAGAGAAAEVAAGAVVEEVVDGDAGDAGSITTISPAIPRFWWTRQK